MRTAAGLVVDPRVHAEEIARFTGYIVEGPADHDCDIWIGGIGADGYGRFHINRGGARFCVRPNRYALALFGGGAVAPRILALHECDNPICTRVGPHHIVGGDQRHNMAPAVASSAALFVICAGNARWRCVKRCAAGGTPARWKPRYSETSRHCGEWT